MLGRCLDLPLAGNFVLLVTAAGTREKRSSRGLQVPSQTAWTGAKDAYL